MRYKLFAIFAVIAITLLVGGRVVVAQSNGNSTSNSKPETTTTTTSGGVEIKSEEETQVERIRQASLSSETFGELSNAERIEELRKLRDMDQKQRCEKLQANIEKRWRYYEANYARHLAKYEQIAANTETAITRLAELETNVESLQSKLTKLRAMIIEIRTIYVLLADDFSKAADVVCDVSKREAYKAVANSAKQNVTSLQGKISSILSFIKSDIRAEFDKMDAAATTQSAQ